MATVSPTFTVPSAITRKVSWLRALVRGYVAVEGMAATVIVAGSVFWLALLVDWLFEPLPLVRVVMWCLTVGVVGYVAWKWLFTRFFARLSDSNIALLLERSFPQIEQSLVTTLQAGRRGTFISSAQWELLANTSSEATRKLTQVRLAKIFRYAPLAWKVALAALLVASIVLFANSKSEAFSFFLKRARLSPELWPRLVELSVHGFPMVDGQRVVNVARDDDFQLNVAASLRDGHKAPDQVEIRYELADGRRGRDSLVRIGIASEGDAAQEYRYEFKHLSEDIVFAVVGGDDRVENLRLHVVERPQIVRTAVECQFPAYLGWSSQTMPFSGRVEVPYGTNVVCRVEVNKPLSEVSVHDPAGNNDLSASIAEKNPKEFSFSLGSCKAERTLLVDLKDTDGVVNREPYRLMIAVVPDTLPELSVQLRGIGSAVTPQAMIPIMGTVIDDHGITEAWIEGEVGADHRSRRALPTSTASNRENSELGVFDLAEINPQSQERLLLVEPGQKIALSVKARDAYNLSDEPHVGTSQRFLLDVVTDSELRALLEKRELGLRQRFEAIYEKMASTRELLGRIELEPKSETGEPLAAEEIAALRERDKLRVSGILQNTTQLSFETFGIAEGFDDIVAELVNNRIDTEELTERLSRGIAEPLKAVAGDLMPELEKRVQRLPEALDDPTGRAAVFSEAVIQADLVLEAMQQVLNRMLELESYNELVELLREIVEDQKKLNNETEIRRREKLRSLLDD